MTTLTATAEESGSGRRPPVHGPSAGLLLQKIASRQATVGVIGLGHPGLPLAVAFAEAGFGVVGIDLDASRVAKLNAGQSHIREVPAARLAPLLAARRDPRLRPIAVQARTRSGSFRASNDYDDLWQTDAVIICVPTHLIPDRGPDVSGIVAATEEIARRLQPGMLVVLESTTYPGTTEGQLLPKLARGTGELRAERVVGRDFFLAFSPQLIDHGRGGHTVRAASKVVGGVTPACQKVATALYRSAMEAVVPVSSPRVAEMVKLLENTFHSQNIGLTREMAIIFICDHLGIDAWDVIDTASTRPFGFTRLCPAPR